MNPGPQELNLPRSEAGLRHKAVSFWCTHCPIFPRSWPCLHTPPVPNPESRLPPPATHTCVCVWSFLPPYPAQSPCSSLFSCALFRGYTQQCSGDHLVPGSKHKVPTQQTWVPAPWASPWPRSWPQTLPTHPVPGSIIRDSNSGGPTGSASSEKMLTLGPRP